MVARLAQSGRQTMANATRGNFLWILIFLLISGISGWSQDAGDQSAPDSGEGGAMPAVSEDAPLPGNAAVPGDQEQAQVAYSTAGMERPSSEVPLRTYFLYGFTANESVQYAPADTLSGPYATDTITRVYGNLDYLRTKGRSQTSIDYRGGGFFYINSNSSNSSNQVQELSVQQRFSWQKTKLVLIDSLSNFPGGDFGAGWFGGASAYNLGVPGGTPLPGNPNTSDFFGFNTFGGIGQGNYLTNVALGEVSHDITPRSTLTFAGAYALTDHIGNQNFINSKQATGSVAYGYQLTHRTTIGAFYGYQDLRFVGGNDVMTNTLQATLGHQISDSTGFTLGGGPEFTRFHGIMVFTIGSTAVPFSFTNHQSGASAYASFYHSIHTSTLAFSYDHLVTNGSGLFQGASSDIASFSWSRPLSRAWGVTVNAGFVRLSTLGSPSTAILGNSYSYGFAGAGVQHKLGGRLSVYATYQFNDESFDNSSCATTSNCNGLVGRHVATLGIAWRSRPIVFGGGGYNGNSAIHSFGNPPTAMLANQPSQP